MGSLRELLGDGARSADFEEFQQFVADMRKSATGASPEMHRLARFTEGVSLACVEIANQEQAAGAEFIDIANAMISGTGIAMSAAILGVLSDDVPPKVFKDFIMDAFGRAIDEMMRSNGLIPKDDPTPQDEQ